MALVLCPDCQAQISESAPACPRCARPMRTLERPPGKFLDPGANMRSCLGGIALLFVLGFVGVVALFMMAHR